MTKRPPKEVLLTKSPRRWRSGLWKRDIFMGSKAPIVGFLDRGAPKTVKENSKRAEKGQKESKRAIFRPKWVQNRHFWSKSGPDRLFAPKSRFLDPKWSDLKSQIENKNTSFLKIPKSTFWHFFIKNDHFWSKNDLFWPFFGPKLKKNWPKNEPSFCPL